MDLARSRSVIGLAAIVCTGAAFALFMLWLGAWIGHPAQIVIVANRAIEESGLFPNSTIRWISVLLFVGSTLFMVASGFLWRIVVQKFWRVRPDSLG